MKDEEQKVLNRAEVAGLLWAARDLRAVQSYWLFGLQYLFGMRIGEVILLQYDDIGPVGGDGWPVCVRVPTVKRKGKEPRDVRLPVPVLSAPKFVRKAFTMEARPKDRRGSPWLFPSVQKGMMHHVTRSWARKEFKRLAAHGGLDPAFATHALRHSAGTHLYEACGQMSLVTRFLRHSGAGKWSTTGGAAVTERYVHVTPQTWKRYRGALDFYPLQPVPYAPGSPARELYMNAEKGGPIRSRQHKRTRRRKK